jgi:predicted dehydrogenase
MKFGIAVLGATGYIGSPYRREIRECPDDAQIVALCARRLPRLKAAAEEDGAEFFSDDWRQVIERPHVNLVLVCTPDALHHEAVMACAQRGVHVLCEKPVGADASQAREIWETYRDTGLAHFVPFWTRYVPIFRRAREVVEAGELGVVRAFVYRWHNPRPAAMPFTWRDDASLSATGSIADVGSHAYDTLRWILGDEAERVLAHAEVITPAKPLLGDIDLSEAIVWGGQHKSEDVKESRAGTTFDYASISVRMRNGTVGTIVLSHAPFLRKGLAPELELHGTDASLSIDRITGALRLFRSDAEPETVATLPDHGLGNRFREHVFPALRERMDHNSNLQHPGLDDGYRVQLFTDAAARSAKQGAWVDLDSIDREAAR